MTRRATLSQVALAWLLRRASNILLIPGTSSVAHLGENLASADLNLPDDAVTALNGIVDSVRKDSVREATTQSAIRAGGRKEKAMTLIQNEASS
jgi:diketogulonate reductase-like aldo/keto reductase